MAGSSRPKSAGPVLRRGRAGAAARHPARGAARGTAAFEARWHTGRSGGDCGGGRAERRGAVHRDQPPGALRMELGWKRPKRWLTEPDPAQGFRRRDRLIWFGAGSTLGAGLRYWGTGAPSPQSAGTRGGTWRTSSTRNDEVPPVPAGTTRPRARSGAWRVALVDASGHWLRSPSCRLPCRPEPGRWPGMGGPALAAEGVRVLGAAVVEPHGMATGWWSGASAGCSTGAASPAIAPAGSTSRVSPAPASSPASRRCSTRIRFAPSDLTQTSSEQNLRMLELTDAGLAPCKQPPKLLAFLVL